MTTEAVHTPATAAPRRTRSVKKPAVVVRPMAPTSSAPGSEAGQASADEATASAQPWRVLIRHYLAETNDVLSAAVLPSEGHVPEGLLSELAIHCVEFLAALLNAPDTSTQWEDRFASIDELQWARDSMLAVVALLGTKHDGTGTAGRAFRTVAQRLVIACEALKRASDITAMSRVLQASAAEPLQEDLPPPVRPEPAANQQSADDSKRVFSELAMHASTLRTFLFDARMDVEQCRDRGKAANNFLMAEYLCAFMGSVCDQMLNYRVAGGPAEWAVDRMIQTEGDAA
ncbi:hypothetical protein [Acidovorax sp. PRC11]|uniref:hypothetical protein n=1 Tax=Acidovorax sp. PRC11 TaxID=2962592 RepID=UPI002881E4DF|nr:hypothetical protein [Acidovorax sp. PRC11]MDT0137753.1 hypothetical protein [Acidovorax sp. PRC11]